MIATTGHPVLTGSWVADKKVHSAKIKLQPAISGCVIIIIVIVVNIIVSNTIIIVITTNNLLVQGHYLSPSSQAIPVTVKSSPVCQVAPKCSCQYHCHCRFCHQLHHCQHVHHHHHCPPSQSQYFANLFNLFAFATILGRIHNLGRVKTGK